MQLGAYQLLDRIGVGGMAEVWRATQVGAEGFERPVAIKRILGHLSADEGFIAMFVDEAKIAVQLSHPNIVQILDLGHIDDEWYIAMELVQGKDLRGITDAEGARGQRMPLEVALHVVTKICDGLHHAHFGGDGVLGSTGPGLRMIHRDVSPQNVLVSFDGEVKVADFGLAKAAGRAAQTQAGTVKGKLAYMSPEQLRGKPLDQRSDVFAVGILLWELVAGDRLFLGQSDRETIEKAYKAVIPPLRDLDPTIPVELENITNKALSASLEGRYQTAMELHDDLEAFVYGSGLILGAASLAAYMRALFPSAQEPSSTRRRDPRAGTAEIDLAEDAVEDDDFDEIELESMPPPAPVFPTDVPPARLAREAAAELGLDDEAYGDGVGYDTGLERSKTEPPTMVADDWSDGTVTFSPGFAEPEPTPRFDAAMAQALDHMDPNADPNATASLDDDALYAAAILSRPPPEDLVTRLHGPENTDLERSRRKDEDRPSFPEAVPTNVVVARERRAPAPAAEERREYDGFDEDEQTTTAGNRRP